MTFIKYRAMLPLCLLFFIPIRADETVSGESLLELRNDAFSALTDMIKKRDELRLKFLALDAKKLRIGSDEEGLEKLKKMVDRKVPFADGNFNRKINALALQLETEEEKGKILDSYYWYLDKSNMHTLLLCTGCLLALVGAMKKGFAAQQINDIATLFAQNKAIMGFFKVAGQKMEKVLH